MCWPRVKEEEPKKPPCAANVWLACSENSVPCGEACPLCVQLLMRLGAAKAQAGRAFQFVQMQVPGGRPAGHAGDLPVSCG